MKLFALSITILLARAGAEIGPHLLDGTDTPTLHRDIARHQLSIEDLLTPFAGKKTGLAFRVHADNDAKTTDGGVADAIVAALRESGLPTDPAEAAAVLKESPVPLSITLQSVKKSNHHVEGAVKFGIPHRLQYEYIPEAEWPAGVKNLADGNTTRATKARKAANISHRKRTRSRSDARSACRTTACPRTRLASSRVAHAPSRSTTAT